MRRLVVLLLAIGGPRAAFAAGDLGRQMETIAAAARGHVGAAVRVLETGESATFHGDDRFPMQSVYKLPIGMAVLRDVDEGRLSLSQLVRVEKSDLVPRSFRSPIRDAHPQGGFDLSLGAPRGNDRGSQAGTSSTVAGLSRATNDIGLVTLPDGRHMAIAVFVSDSTADLAMREGVIAKIARAAWDALLPPQR